MQLQQALRVLVDAMRDNARDELPDRERARKRDGGSDVEQERDDRPLRTMGYFDKKPAKVTQQRAANSGDGPLLMRPVLLAKPKKEAA